MMLSKILVILSRGFWQRRTYANPRGADAAEKNCTGPSRPPLSTTYGLERGSGSRLPQSHHQPHRSDEKQWRGIKSRRRSRDGNARNRVPQNRHRGVSESVEKHDKRVEPCQRTQPSRIARSQRRQRKTERHAGDQPHQPFAKAECRHGEPPKARPHCGYCWVVDIEKSRRGFVEDV